MDKPGLDFQEFTLKVALDHACIALTAININDKQGPR